MPTFSRTARKANKELQSCLTYGPVHVRTGRLLATRSVTGTKTGYTVRLTQPYASFVEKLKEPVKIAVARTTPDPLDLQQAISERATKSWQPLLNK